MDIEAIYSAIKSGNGDKLFNDDNFDVNSKNANGCTLLHLAAQRSDIEFTKKLVIKGAVYNSQNAEGKTPSDVASDLRIKDLLNNVRKFFKAVKKGKHDEISKYINENSLVNAKEYGGYSALHWAVGKGHEEIIHLLFKNGVKVLQFTDKGNTPLHTSVAKGNVKMTQMLLQHIPAEQMFEFINSQTLETKSACLHISAENGNLDIVHLLLKNGAIYNIKNKAGFTAHDLSKDVCIKYALKLTRDLFSCANKGDSSLLDKLNHLELNTFEAVTNARDMNKNTILTELISNNHKISATKLVKLIKDRSLVKDGWKLEELQILEKSAKLHLHFSDLYMPMIQCFGNPNQSEINSNPWKSLKEGSYFLGNAHALVSTYKRLRPGLIEDENIKTIHDTLNQLQFDPSHISSGYTNEAYGGTVKCFVSKAQNSEYYYRLLHSSLTKDVAFFIEMAKNSIDTPTKKFLKSLEKPCLSYQLMKAVENNDKNGVIECIHNGVDVNFPNLHRITPLECAAKDRKVEILRILLENGADIQQVLSYGNTLLHVVVSDISLYPHKNFERNPPVDVTKCLLKHGAVYDYRNEQGRTPLDVSKCQDSSNLIRNVDICFKHAGNDDLDLIPILQTMDKDDFDAITRARNSDGYTLLQLATSSGHKDLEKKIWEILKSSIHNYSTNELEDATVRKLENIKKLSQKHQHFSNIYLPTLRTLSESDGSEINSCPWKTLMTGSYYLCNAYNLVHGYKDYFPILENIHIEKINDMLEKFQFDPKHIPTCSSDGKRSVSAFISKAGGTEYYYKILSSNDKKDVRHFIKLCEEFIEVPVEHFMQISLKGLYNLQKCTIL